MDSNKKLPEYQGNVDNKTEWEVCNWQKVFPCSPQTTFHISFSKPFWFDFVFQNA